MRHFLPDFFSKLQGLDSDINKMCIITLMLIRMVAFNLDIEVYYSNGGARNRVFTAFFDRLMKKR